MRETRFSLAAEPPQQRILVLAIETKPLGEVLTTSGANWFSRRGRTCRLHQPYIYMGKVGETVKFGWERHPRRGTVGPSQERDGRPIPMYHHLFTLGKCVYLFRIHSLDAGSFQQRSSAQIGKSFENLNHQFGDLTWVFFPQQRPKLNI